MSFLPRQGSFPSLRIRAERLEPYGSYAEAQAQYLLPDPAAVQQLTTLLQTTRTGLAAHFYMDAELQGVLSASSWPHTFVSDSLAMADRAVDMIQGGAQRISVLGVDFMSENVRAVLDTQGLQAVPVYRMATEPIGCSLADAAASASYDAWLDEAARTPQALHVIYINTGLDVKARAEHRVPTLTCTSSNALKTILQAIHQIPDVAIRFGPDTCMGHNLSLYLQRLAAMTPPQVAQVHPGVTPAAIARALDRFQAFPDGSCVVHQVFSSHVAQVIREHYQHALITAHLEVPGEMFELALQAQHQGRGVVGSTADILAFINQAVDTAIASNQAPSAPISVVLGTEAGMITSIVRSVQARLRAHHQAARPAIEVEIIFPVAQEAVAATDDASLPIVPGVDSSEGCSAMGGCASCPYMKMNSLQALFDLLERIQAGATDSQLRAFHPRRYDAMLDGQPLAAWGTRPILAMRHFQKTGQLSDSLVARIKG